jgi:glyoxylase-like metal-dependent hydrolase (beta-lactamase superfamily II)
MIFAAVLAALGWAGSAYAASAGARVRSVPAAAQSFRVGELQVWALRDAQVSVTNNGKVFGVDAEPDAVTELLQAADLPNDRISLSVNVLLLRFGKLVVLLDSGVGAASRGALVKSLQKAGVEIDDVTNVLITHPHMDHIGGLITPAGSPAFPNAIVQMTEAAWAALQRQYPMLGKAIAQQVHVFAPGAQVLPVVRSVPLAGHTPGHTGYEIASGNARLLDIGDLAHSSLISLARPQWTLGFDEDKATAKATRIEKLGELARSHEHIFAPHFAFPGTGYILVQDEAYSWKPDSP